MISGGAAGILDEETTITRMIGMLSARPNGETASQEVAFAIGCAVFSSVAVAAGATSLPSPVSYPDFEWLFWFGGNLRRSATASDDAGLCTLRVPFDVSGQRIVRSEFTPVWIAESDTGSLQIAVNGRYLVKLS